MEANIYDPKLLEELANHPNLDQKTRHALIKKIEEIRSRKHR